MSCSHSCSSSSSLSLLFSLLVVLFSRSFYPVLTSSHYNDRFIPSDLLISTVAWVVADVVVVSFVSLFYFHKGEYSEDFLASFFAAVVVIEVLVVVVFRCYLVVSFVFTFGCLYFISRVMITFQTRVYTVFFCFVFLIFRAYSIIFRSWNNKFSLSVITICQSKEGFLGEEETKEQDW